MEFSFTVICTHTPHSESLSRVWLFATIARQAPLPMGVLQARILEWVAIQGIFPIQGSNPGLLHCRWILYSLSHQGNLFPAVCNCCVNVLIQSFWHVTSHAKKGAALNAEVLDQYALKRLNKNINSNLFLITLINLKLKIKISKFPKVICCVCTVSYFLYQLLYPCNLIPITAKWG